MTEQEIRDKAPSGATHKITSAGHGWYFKKHWWHGWVIYHRHCWVQYKDSVFKFNLHKLKPI